MKRYNISFSLARSEWGYCMPVTFVITILNQIHASVSWVVFFFFFFLSHSQTLTLAHFLDSLLSLCACLHAWRSPVSGSVSGLYLAIQQGAKLQMGRNLDVQGSAVLIDLGSVWGLHTRRRSGTLDEYRSLCKCWWNKLEILWSNQTLWKSSRKHMWAIFMVSWGGPLLTWSERLQLMRWWKWSPSTSGAAGS